MSSSKMVTATPPVHSMSSTVSAHSIRPSAHKTRTKPPMALRKQTQRNGNADTLHNGHAHAQSMSEKLSSTNASVPPPKISLDDAVSLDEHRQSASVNFAHRVAVVGGDTPTNEDDLSPVRVQGQGQGQRQSLSDDDNGRRTRPTQRKQQNKQSKTHSRKSSQNSRHKRSKNSQSKSHRGVAKALLDELYQNQQHQRDHTTRHKNGTGKSGKMGDLLKEGMLSAEEMVLEQYQYGYYYFVHTEQAIFEQYHRQFRSYLEAQKAKVQKSVKSKA